MTRQERTPRSAAASAARMVLMRAAIGPAGMSSSRSVAGRPGVDQVVNDAAILSKFYRLLDAARNAVVIIAVILLVAVGKHHRRACFRESLSRRKTNPRTGSCDECNLPI